MKYTTGTWNIKATDNAIRRLTGAKTPDEVEANARLIAAAPTMFETLQRIANRDCAGYADADHEGVLYAQWATQLINKIKEGK